MTTKKARAYTPAFAPSDCSDFGRVGTVGKRTARLDPSRLHIERNRVYGGEEAIMIDNVVWRVGCLHYFDITNAVSCFLRNDRDHQAEAQKWYEQLGGADEGAWFWDRVE